MFIVDNIELRSQYNKSAYKQYKNIKINEKRFDFTKNIISLNPIFVKQLTKDKLPFTNRNTLTD